MSGQLFARALEGASQRPGIASCGEPAPASVTLSSDHHLRRPYRSRCAGPRETPYPWEKWSADIQRERSTSAAYHEAVEYWHQDLSKTFEECLKVCLESRGLGCGGVEEGNCAKAAKSLDQRPGTASREEHKSAHMLPNPPQMPPPIELRIQQILRQHTSRPGSASPRHRSVIGQAPSPDELACQMQAADGGPCDGPSSASSWEHDWKSGACLWHTDERGEERQCEQEDNHHGWRWTTAWSSGWSDEPGSASSWEHNSKSQVGAWHADERQEERQRKQKGNRRSVGPPDGPGSASPVRQDSESMPCADRSGDRKACLQESMRKWAEQASMREDKALDIARKSKAKRQRAGGDSHRAWLDRKYLKRTLKRLRQQSSSTAPAPGTASARAASEQASRLSQTRASNIHPGSARIESKGAASARSFNKDV